MNLFWESTHLPLDRFADMLAESEVSGYQFLRRVVDEWESVVNLFARPGEALLIAEMSRRWVGVCGLSIDPYQGDPRAGRVRNVYVLADYRRTGIGRRRVEEEGPARLYESLGFRTCRGVPNCTHILEWSD
jgi:hypothetical protein